MTYWYTQPNAYDYIQSDIESKLHTYLNKEANDIRNIFIVGAYHGYEIAKLLHNYPYAVINAFEAVQEHYKILEIGYKANNRVNLFNCAVSDVDEQLNFFELENGGEGSGSLLPFQGNEYGHPFKIKKKFAVPSITLAKLFPNQKIDLLWVDVQGAELLVLKGTNLNNVHSLFLEIHTKDYIKLWDKEPYKGQCYKEDLENYLVNFELHSIGLDNANGNGQGNSFWIKK